MVFNVLDQFLILPFLSARLFLGFWWLNGLTVYLIGLWGVFFNAAQERKNTTKTLIQFFVFSWFTSKWYDMFRSRLTQAKYTISYFWMYLLISILLFNYLGLIPYSITATSFIVSTLFWSLSGFVASFFITFRAWLWQFVEIFSTPGTHIGIRLGLIFIELISYFARIVSLAIRLFANMMAGHSLLKVLNGFCGKFLVALSIFTLVGLILLNVIWAITFMEFCIAFLQAYVFITLSTIYLNEAINQH